jgi:hypothetical protein
MMNSQTQLVQAITELRAGRKTQAQALLVQLVQQQPDYPEAWVALSACFDDPEKKEYCLSKALSIDPQHPQALRALAELHAAPAEAPPEPEPLLEETGSPSEAVAEPEGGPFAKPLAAPAEELPPAPEEAFLADEGWEAAALEQEEAPVAGESAFVFEEGQALEKGQAIEESWAFEDEFAVESEAGATVAPSGPLEPWEIPFAAAGTAAAAAGAGFEPAGGPPVSSWDVPAEWSAAASGAPGARPGDSVVDVRGAKADRKAAERAPGRKLSWLEVWFMVLTSPNERTFHKILADPNARPGRGFLWVFLTSLIGVLIAAVAFGVQMQTALPEMLAQMPQPLPFDPQQVMGYSLIGMIVGSPLIAAFSVLGVIITAALYQLIAKFFIGEGSFGEMAYALSAISAPLSLINFMISLLALLLSFAGQSSFVLSLVGGLLGLYGLFLTLVAIKAVNRFGWGASCGTVIAVPLLIGACSCLFFFLLGGTGLLGSLQGLPTP